MCERLEHLAKKKARYAQRTEGQRLQDAHRLRTRRAQQQQQAKKRPDELVNYDVLNFRIGGLDVCLFVCWVQNILFKL